MARRKGKIAQLPEAIREQVNQMLADGKTYAGIATWLAAAGFPDISDKNVENWCKGDGDGSSGFNDWDARRQRLESMRDRREFAQQIVKENAGGAIHEAAVTLAASSLYEVLSDFDFDALRAKLQEKPELLTEIANTLARLSGSALDFARYKDNVEQRKKAIETQLREAKGDNVITQETIEKIERELKLL